MQKYIFYSIASGMGILEVIFLILYSGDAFKSTLDTVKDWIWMLSIVLPAGSLKDFKIH